MTDALRGRDLAAVGHQLSHDEELLALSLLTARTLRCPISGCELGVRVIRVCRDRYVLSCGRRHRFSTTFASLDPLLQSAIAGEEDDHA